MAEVDLSVEDQEGGIVDERTNNGFWIGPWCVLVKVFGQLVESVLVTGMQFVGIALVELLLKVKNKVLDSFREVSVLKEESEKKNTSR